MPPYKTDWTQDTLLHLRDMKQAQVSKWGEAPKCVDVAHPGDPKQGEVQLKVIACSVHALVRSRAAGTHYSAKSLPHIPGTDGVGRTSDGKLVYFNAISDTGGSMTEVINIAVERTTPIPDGADPVQVAGLLNPVSASWMALSARTHGLAPGFTALILGATGVSGSAAVEVARALGASKVVGAARSAARLSGLGLDGTIELANDPSQTDWSHAMEVDVVLDFMYVLFCSMFLSEDRIINMNLNPHQPTVQALQPLTLSIDMVQLQSRCSGP